jgi:hypothetical protein
MNTCEMCRESGARPATVYGERIDLCAVCAHDLGTAREEPAAPQSLGRLFDVVASAVPAYLLDRVPDLADVETIQDPVACRWRVFATVMSPGGMKRGGITAVVDDLDVRRVLSHAELFHLIVDRLEAARAEFLANTPGLA